MGVNFRTALFSIIGLIIMTGCATSRSAAPVSIALFAPFEGRYREVGYEMLYAARLALAEAQITQVELLPIDDGGNVANARDHAAAIALNPKVQLVIAAGFPATDADVLEAFAETPVIIVGSWSIATEQTPPVFRLSSREIASSAFKTDADLVAFAQRNDDITGGELLTLDQVRRLRGDLANITILSSAALPSPDFVERYRASDSFAPEPRLLATLTYDVTHIAAQVVSSTGTRQDAAAALQTIQYDGINGVIQFDADGFWQDAPLHRYQYAAEDQLIEVTEAATSS